jgi:hypothetical protein
MISPSRLSLHPKLEFWLDKFPLCPSVNNQLRVSGQGMFKTKEARNFDQQVMTYRLMNIHRVNSLEMSMKQLLSDGFVFRVDCYFIFEKSKLFSKKKEVKTIDAQNRCKATIDALVKLVEVDDKYFFAGDAEKLFTTNVVEANTTIIRITEWMPRSLEDLRKNISQQILPGNKS